MKTTLNFDLPEEKKELLLAIHAGKMYSQLWDLEQEIRKYIKYDKLTKKETVILESLRNLIDLGFADE